MKEEITTKAETRPVGSVPVEEESSPGQPILPGIEDLAAENQSLKAELHMRTAVYDLQTRLAQAGARSPELLIEKAKESFQFSEQGELTNAEAVVEKLRRRFPEQFAPPSIDATAGRTPRPTLTKEALARMTPAEIRQLDWAEVKAALSNG